MEDLSVYLLLVAVFGVLLWLLAYLSDYGLPFDRVGGCSPLHPSPYGELRPMLLTDDISIGNPLSYSGRVPVAVPRVLDCKYPLSTRYWTKLTPCDKRKILDYC